MTLQNRCVNTSTSHDKNARAEQRADKELGLAKMREKLRRAYAEWKNENEGVGVDGDGAETPEWGTHSPK